jgi:hypothetical protein
VFGLMGIGMEEGISDEPFVAAVCPDWFDNGAQPFSAIVSMGGRGVGSVQVGRLVRYPVDRPSTKEELVPAYVGLV